MPEKSKTQSNSEWSRSSIGSLLGFWLCCLGMVLTNHYYTEPGPAGSHSFLAIVGFAAFFGALCLSVPGLGMTMHAIGSLFSFLCQREGQSAQSKASAGLVITLLSLSLVGVGLLIKGFIYLLKGLL